MKNVNFYKMHGLGNDFVIFFEKHNFLEKETIKSLSDRRTGIGCDLIVVLEDGNEIYDSSAKFFNSNGTEAEICGNALRCVGKLLYEKLKKNILVVETMSGLIEVEVLGNNKFQVDLGSPRFEWDQIPLTRSCLTNDLNFNLGNLQGGFALNLGNPHIIFFNNSFNEKEFIRHSKKVASSKIFVDGVNVSNVEIKSKEFIVAHTYERGCGLTKACGSGACASVVAANKLNLCNKKVTVKMTGGELEVEISDDDHILMIGHAVEVYKGEITIRNDKK